MRHDGRQASWPGISTYHWDGERLTECWVEQDYLARTRQLETGRADDVERPAVDPWAAEPVPADGHTEAAVRAWLEKGDLSDAGHVRLDDGGVGVEIEAGEVTVDDLFSAGPRAAFHLTLRGRYAGGLPGLDGAAGTEVVVGASGVVEVARRFGRRGEGDHRPARGDPSAAEGRRRRMSTVLRSVALSVDSVDRAVELFAGLLGGTAGDGVVRFPPGVDLELRLDGEKGIRQVTFAVDDPDTTTRALADLGYRAAGDGRLAAPAGYGGDIVLEPPGDRIPVAATRGDDADPVAIRSLDHVCAPAARLEHSIAIFAGALGGDMVFGGDNDVLGTRSGQVRFLPGTKVELLQARRPGVPVGEFAARFPDRFHHVTMVTADLPGLITRLEGAGYPLIDTDLDSRTTWRETFVRPSATFGALIQLVETPLEYKEPLSDDVIDDVLAGRHDQLRVFDAAPGTRSAATPSPTGRLVE